MTKHLSETDHHRLLCDGRELLVEVSYSSDCSGKRRWLPLASPELSVMNTLIKAAFINHYADGRSTGVVFSYETYPAEMVRIVRQPAPLETFSECIEISTTRDGLGEPIWFDVDGYLSQNNLLEPVLVQLCAGC